MTTDLLKTLNSVRVDIVTLFYQMEMKKSENDIFNDILKKKSFGRRLKKILRLPVFGADICCGKNQL